MDPSTFPFHKFSFPCGTFCVDRRAIELRTIGGPWSTVCLHIRNWNVGVPFCVGCCQRSVHTFPVSAFCNHEKLYFCSQKRRKCCPHEWPSSWIGFRWYSELMQPWSLTNVNCQWQVFRIHRAWWNYWLFLTTLADKCFIQFERTKIDCCSGCSCAQHEKLLPKKHALFFV